MYRPSRQTCSSRTEETMRYLGLDVHSKATVSCLLDAEGKELARRKVPTTAPELEDLIRRSRGDDKLLVGQEVGTMSYFVHDVVTAAGARILSFNAQQLRMISSSRKKTDRRDAFWLAKALQTGMTPHPVYIPGEPVRRLRGLLGQRDAVAGERKRWLLRARSYLRAGGHGISGRSGSVACLREKAIGSPEGLDLYLSDGLDLCARRECGLQAELRELEKQLRTEARGIEVIRRLKTIPAVGEWVALRIYAAVGEVSRFPTARALCSYAGLVPAVHQSGDVHRMGGITRMGSPVLRSALIQAGHVLLCRCDPAKAGPLQEIAARVQTTRGRRKIAVVAAARHILRIAYYVLRDGTTYEPTRLRSMVAEEPPAAA